ncbi:MAG: 1-deoxy-D-xylulose-5-phosphate reductoisomerase [Firmicutes bacterium]|nr:1-deoxy-D-xylulose-5-phosphate reductoisomerase [Bacillota bacterium]
MKRITLLGSTGSIGTQTLDVVRENPELYEIYALACASNTDLLFRQIREFHPEAVSLLSEEAAEKTKQAFPDLAVYSGAEGLEVLAGDTAPDLVVNAVVGMAGLMPTYRAICAGRTIALANKETLVAGGRLIMKTAEDRGVSILPVDSEHSAVFQSMQGSEKKRVRKIILTASGGAFRGWTRKDLENVTAAQALKHPNWNMGAKVTVDSSTLMNKGFEVAEARWLFDMEPERIEVVVHPESIIHSMVEYEDRAVMAQLGVPDMKVPINYALGYPDRVPLPITETLDFVKTAKLTFEKPDLDTFGCLRIAYDALKAGGTYCTALNAADEVLVDAFLREKIRYLDIQELLQKVMDRHRSGDASDPESIFRADAEARELTEKLIAEM